MVGRLRWAQHRRRMLRAGDETDLQTGVLAVGGRLRCRKMPWLGAWWAAKWPAAPRGGARASVDVVGPTGFRGRRVPAARSTGKAARVRVLRSRGAESR